MPPPPHRPATPSRRKGLVLGAVLAGAAALVALALLLTFLTSNGSFLPWAEDDSSQGQEEQDTQEPGAEAPQDDADDADDADEAEEPDGPPSDMPVTSPDGAVQYDVTEVTCDLSKHNIRSGLQADAEYCVVRLGLTNTSGELLRFDAQDQILTTTSQNTREAENPSSEERRQSLWEGPGVAPADSVTGELVFILRGDDGRPEFLSLTHGDGAERTDISISHLL